MKIDVYNDTPDTPTVPKMAATLKLEERPSGAVVLVAVDSSGEKLPCGAILKFTTAGVIFRFSSIDPAFGFDLDDEGRVKFFGGTYR